MSRKTGVLRGLTLLLGMRVSSKGLFAGPVSLEALGVATRSEASQEACGGVRNQIQLQAVP